MNHSDIQELLGAYALDAVEPDEAREIETHLLTCAECRREVHEHRDIVSRLSGAGIEAPHHVWDAISSHVRSEPTSAESPPTPSPTRLLANRPHREWPLRAVLAVAAVAILLALGSGWQALRLQHEVNRLNAASSGSAITTALQRTLLDPSTQRVTLTASSQPTALAEIVLSTSGQAFVVNRGLRPLTSHATYQLWGLTNGRAISLGVLGSSPSTVAIAVGSGSTMRTFAITVEPLGGVIVPDHQPIAAGTV